MDKSEFKGTFEPPPAHAPQEVSSTHVGPTADQLIAAQRNERSLQPLVYEPRTGPALDVPKQVVQPRTQPVLPPRDENRTHQPAASNSDSPSRGIPREVDDPGKRITGGFGVQGPPQYYPLDGSELRVACEDMLEKIHTRIQNDLRFHPAMVYPRVRAVLTLTIEAYGQAESHQIKSEFDHSKTPVAVALEVGAVHSTFEVAETIQEFDKDGNPENPPDRVRDALGLEKPRKQFVDMAGGRQLVDRPSLLNSF